ncbi:MAG: tetratricopeptide repeat protein [Deltaproteobacteria bacterium]|nr:tetratricopeptide repeat protein [Deltaproteobacteria bacterium]
MFRFNVGSIPVQVHGSHLLFSALLGWSWRPPPHGAWPASALADPSLPGQGAAMAAWVGLFVAMAFVSILAHELGHAFVSLAFGYRPTVDLVALGGLTRPNANETIPWFKEVTLTLAGPGMGLLLCLLALIGVHLVPGGTTAALVLNQLAQMNGVWSVFNLLPIAPLDGGQVATAVLIRVFGRVGFLFAQVLTLVLAVALGLFALRTGGMLTLLLVVMVGIRAVQMVGAYQRGEMPALEPSHPSEVAFREAVSLFQAGRLDEAQRMGERALALEMTPSLRGRFQHLLGWAAVKLGQGRRALDHFSQVGAGATVEPQALAAAFSLVGDEGRALPLWAQAAEETGDATVLHEYAGALLRAGREAEARALPGVDAGAAWACAERLLFLRGDFAGAATAGEAAFRERATAQAAYDVACAWARAGHVEAALGWLERAAPLGFRDVHYAETDEDLRPLHGHPSFRAWLDGLQESGAR